MKTITDEEFIELPRDERLERILHHIGIEFNKCMADTMNICGSDFESSNDFCPNINSEKELEIIVNTIREDFIERMKQTVGKFNRLCHDIILYNFKIIDIDLEKHTCRVVPYFEFIDEEE